MVKNILKPLRIDHWTKNLVLIIGYVFSIFFIKNNLNINIYILFNSFLVLCLSASSNYLINEFLDRENDKFHPKKKVRTYVGLKKDNNIFLKYIILVSISVFLSFFVNNTFVILNLVFLLFGLMYNVKPLRLKDIFLIDVILESANNPLRFLMGWAILIPTHYPPVSIVLFFWLVGCFLMTMKRYSEFKFLKKFIKPGKYRKSFNHYTIENLFNLSILYSLLSFFFFAIFVIKYKIELILISPIACMLYVRIFNISFKENSLITNVEKIYKDRTFVNLIFLGLIFCIILLQLDLDFLKIFQSRDLVPI